MNIHLPITRIEATMKTLIIIPALVCLTIAAPTNQEYGLEAAKENIGNLPEYKREKKSAQDFFLSPSTMFALPEMDIQSDNLNVETNRPEARSHFSYKGPIVVKKKSGYHVYRDSEEERDAADPRENCNKQLRVKLCNEDITGKSTNKRNTGIHNDDVESTIQIAREAIDILQRDINKLEKGANEETDHLENTLSMVDKNMHQRIESVREALRRVENLKAINMKPKNTKEEIVNDVGHMDIEKARLTQWKEATQSKDTAHKLTEEPNSVTNSNLDSEKARLAQWKENTQDKNTNTELWNHVTKSELDSDKARLTQWKEATQNKETHTKAFDDITKSSSDKHQFAQWKEVTTDKDTHMHNIALDDLAVTKTEKQRLAQWKDAIEHIHSNLEVPINMEDSFKSEEHHNQMMKSANLATVHDMSSAASEQVSTKVDYHNHAPHKHLQKMEKSADTPTDAQTTTLLLKENVQPISELKLTHPSHDTHSKHAESKWEFHGKDEKHDGENTQHKNVYVFMKNAEESKTTFKNTENNNNKITESLNNEHSVMRADNPESLSKTNSLTDSKKYNEIAHGKTAEPKEEYHGQGNQHYKDVYIFMKNAAQLEGVSKNTENTHQDTNKLSDSDTTSQGKYAEPTHDIHIQHVGPGYAPIKAPHHHYYEKEIKHLPQVTKYYGHYSKHGKSEDSDRPMARYGASPMPKPHVDEMHSGHGQISMNKPHFDEMHSGHGHSAMYKPHIDEMHSGHGHSSMNKEHLGDMHSGHGHVLKQKPYFEDPHHHYHGNPHHSHYPMHGKSSEFDAVMQPSDQINMQDFIGKSALENIQWKDHFHTARGSYGAPSYPGYPSYNIASSGGADAYGLFPKVKSGCGVPLLLNCSPTVVHGKLVKSYSNYSAPQYRSEEDLHLQQKREIMKSNDNTENKIINSLMNANKNNGEEKHL